MRDHFLVTLPVLNILCHQDETAHVDKNFIFLAETGGHPFNIEDLSDAQLFRVVEDLRSSVKRLSLETKMFEGIFLIYWFQIFSSVLIFKKFECFFLLK